MSDYCDITRQRPAGAASVLRHLTHTVRTAPERRQPGKSGMKLGSTSLPRLHSAEDTAGGALAVQDSLAGDPVPLEP